MNQWCMTNWTIRFFSSGMLAYCHSQHHSSLLCLSFFLSCVLPLSIPAPVLCCFCQGCCLSCVPSRHVAVVTAVKGMRERENYHFFNSLYLPSLHLSVHTMPCQLPLLSITFFFLPRESISHPVLNCFTCCSHIFVSQDSHFIILSQNQSFSQTSLTVIIVLYLLIRSKLSFYMPPHYVCNACLNVFYVSCYQTHLAGVLSDGDVLMRTLWLRRC